MTARSVNVPARQAAIIPNGTATSTANTMVATARARVGSRRWPISLVTGMLEKIETPRSPDSTLPIQVKNWT